MRRLRTRKGLLSFTTALIAILFGSLWYGFTYPPALVGTWSNGDSDKRFVLTLRPTGQGYLKAFDLAEQQLHWSADGNKVILHLEDANIAALLKGFSSTTPDLIATRVQEGDSGEHLDVDAGSTYSLHQGAE